MVSKAEEKRRRAYVLHALAVYAKQAIDNEDLRDELAPGDEQPVDVSLEASVGRGKYACALSVDLAVGRDTDAKQSEAPGAALVLATFLRLLPGTTRESVVADIRANNWLPAESLDVTPEEVKQAGDLLKRMRRSLPMKRKKGAVSITAR